MDGEVPGVTSVQPLATGGYSTVYRAWQPELDRWVAVKVLGLTLSDRRARDRFLRECKAVGRLTGHPNIVTVLAPGITRDNRPFLTMDLFERGSLAGLVADSGPLSVEQALRIGVKLSGALETAHRAGILHLDLKPENVLLSHFGEPALADFGIATLGEARGETKAFTASHAAPEVLEGRAPTEAADVYGLGSTLWTALAGRLPFGDEDQGVLKLMHRVLQDPLPPLGRSDVPPSLEAALQLAMAKDPAQRPPTALAFGNYLRRLQGELGLPLSDLVVPDDLERLVAPDATVVEHGQDEEPLPPPPRRPGPVTMPSEDRAQSGAGRSVKARSPGRPIDRDRAAREDGPDSPWAPSPRPSDAPSIDAGGSSTPSPTKERRATDRHRPKPVPSPAGDAAPHSSRTRSVAMAAGALVLAVVVVAIALLIGDGDGDGDGTGDAPQPSTVAATRSPTNPAVRVVADGVAVVTWKPPADRGGLTGYVVLHGPKGTDTRTQHVAGTALEAVVNVTTPGSHCFVVAAVYGPKEAAAGSEPVCT